MNAQKIEFSKKFEKQILKLIPAQREAFYTRLKLFQVDSTNSVLRPHPLKGRYTGYYSINISGDLRALYYKKGDDIVIFALIGTHSQLYG